MDEEEDEYIHVYPLFGKEHVLNGIECWCHPEQDAEYPCIVIHNVEN